jgi:lipoate-protein ligase A
MMYYIESRDTDPYRNLALEQFVFDSLDREHSYFMLWQNHNAIIVGKHQNTLGEINAAFVKEKDITVVRRLSGGGAVYHDMGNLNFTFITDAADREKGMDFSVFCKPIREALRSFGAPVEISGRNDMTIEEKKFSGNAQYVKQNRIMHHGTILYDSDLGILSQALNPEIAKIESKGVKSVRSRVTNIKPYMKADMSVADFWAALKKYMIAAFDMREFTLAPEQDAAVDELREKVYAQWSWNYGNSPPCNMRRARRIEGCGKIEILLDVAEEGIIKTAAFYGDFFGNLDPADLEGRLIGHHLEYEELKAAFADTQIDQYFHALSTEAFLSLLLE